MRLDVTMMQMHRMRRGCLMAEFLISITLGSRPSEAQYTADFQTNIISGVTSNWSGDYVVGPSAVGDVLLIQNSGVLTDPSGYLGNGLRGSNNNVTVTDAGSVWSNSVQLIVGYDGRCNSLVISNGGRVIVGGAGYNIVGYHASSSNNTVLVTDIGSVWSNSYGLIFGQYGQHNSLVISNGGRVIAGDGTSIGVDSTGGSSNSVVITGTGSALISGIGAGSGNLSLQGGGNSLVIGAGGQAINRYGQMAGTANRTLVTDAGSVWSNSSVYIGESGSGNSLVVSNGGLVVSDFGVIGEWTTDSNNSVRVVDGGVWQNKNNQLHVGDQGSSNSLAIAGGLVFATSLTVGVASSNCDNLVQLDSGSLIVTNMTHDAVLEVRHGKLVLNGGVLQADTLVMTNPCAAFVHTGGTLIVGNVVLALNTFRIVSVARQSNDMLVTWMMGPGATNALQATTAGSYNTNNFSDIFVVTNNTAIGTITNYLDVGAATNTLARYYRARLVP